MRVHIFKFCILILSLLATKANSQSIDTVYYGLDGIVSSKDSAYFVRYVTYDNVSKRYQYEQWSLFDLSHGFPEKGELLSLNPEIIDGKIEKIDLLGNKVSYLYKKNKFIDIIHYSNSGNESIPIYPNNLVDQSISPNEIVEIGDKLTSKLGLQISELKNSNKRIFIQFVIEKDGSISNCSVRNSFAYKLKPYIIKELNQMNLKPARHNGRNVRVLVFSILH
ncbi:energy transducer TonB [Flammeovirga sp. EKP202]|uniref:energy transducer TonB n=1 Tax=Flammeovirga sp. EKP202 TaxID=2770592 RepID=UPI001CB87FD0|nr:hypothetical protein [Flammeovirga sp. EKP202]